MNSRRCCNARASTAFYRSSLQLDVQIGQSNELRLAATIAGPKGTLPLRSR
jgi:hypothetical protein